MGEARFNHPVFRPKEGKEPPKPSGGPDRTTTYLVVAALTMGAALVVGAFVWRPTPIVTEILHLSSAPAWLRVEESFGTFRKGWQRIGPLREGGVVPDAAWFRTVMEREIDNFMAQVRITRASLEAVGTPQSVEATRGFIEQANLLKTAHKIMRNEIDEAIALMHAYWGEASETVEVASLHYHARFGHEVYNQLGSLFPSVEFLERGLKGGSALPPGGLADLLQDCQVAVRRAENGLSYYRERPGVIRAIALTRDQMFGGKVIQFDQLGELGLSPDRQYELGCLIRESIEHNSEFSGRIGVESVIRFSNTGRVLRVQTEGLELSTSSGYIDRLFARNGWVLERTSNGYTINLGGDELGWKRVLTLLRTTQGGVEARKTVEAMRREMGAPTVTWMEGEMRRIVEALRRDWMEIEPLLVKSRWRLRNPDLEAQARQVGALILRMGERREEADRLRQIVTVYGGWGDLTGGLARIRSYLFELFHGSNNDAHLTSLVAQTLKEAPAKTDMETLLRSLHSIRDHIAQFVERAGLRRSIEMMKERATWDGTKVVDELGEVAEHLTREQSFNAALIMREMHRNARRQTDNLVFRIRGGADGIHFIDNAGGIKLEGGVAGASGQGLSQMERLAQLNDWALTHQPIEGGTDFFLKFS